MKSQIDRLANRGCANSRTFPGGVCSENTGAFGFESTSGSRNGVTNDRSWILKGWSCDRRGEVESRAFCWYFLCDSRVSCSLALAGNSGESLDNAVCRGLVSWGERFSGYRCDLGSSLRGGGRLMLELFSVWFRRREGLTFEFLFKAESKLNARLATL